MRRLSCGKPPYWPQAASRSPRCQAPWFVWGLLGWFLDVQLRSARSGVNSAACHWRRICCGFRPTRGSAASMGFEACHRPPCDHRRTYTSHI